MLFTTILRQEVQKPSVFSIGDRSNAVNSNELFPKNTKFQKNPKFPQFWRPWRHWRPWARPLPKRSHIQPDSHRPSHQARANSPTALECHSAGSLPGLQNFENFEKFEKFENIPLIFTVILRHKAKNTLVFG